jgi:membrane protein DedA with SNARE-associated domain
MSVDAWLALTSLESFWWAFGLFFAAALVEMLFPPFPGDAVYFFGLVALSAGGTPVYGSIVAACLGGTVGFVVVYWVGHVYGRRFFMKRKSGLWSPRSLERVEHWFARWGGWLIVFGRFLSGVRALVPLVAGIGQYPKVKSFVLGGVSIVIWNTLLAMGALVLGRNWESVSRTYATYNYIFWLVAGVLILIWLARWYWLRRRQQRTIDTGDHS